MQWPVYQESFVEYSFWIAACRSVDCWRGWRCFCCFFFCCRIVCETNWIGCDEKSGFKIGSENDGSTFQGEEERKCITNFVSFSSFFFFLAPIYEGLGGRPGAGGSGQSVGRSVGRPTVRWRARGSSGAKIGCHLHNISKLYSAPQNQPSFLSDDGRTAIIHTQRRDQAASRMKGDWRGAEEFKLDAGFMPRRREAENMSVLT